MIGHDHRFGGLLDGRPEAQPFLLDERPAQGFRLLPLGDVVDHPDGAHDPPGRVPDVLALFVNRPDLPGVPADDPVLDLVAVAAFLQGAQIGGVDGPAVVRMDRGHEGLIGRAEFLRIEPEDPVDLVRPGQPVGDDVELPAAEVGDLLRSLVPISRSRGGPPRSASGPRYP